MYSNEDRLRLLPKLEPLTQQEVPVRIEKLLADEPSPEVRREPEALRSAVAAPAH